VLVRELAPELVLEPELASLASLLESGFLAAAERREGLPAPQVFLPALPVRLEELRLVRPVALLAVLPLLEQLALGLPGFLHLAALQPVLLVPVLPVPLLLQGLQAGLLLQLPGLREAPRAGWLPRSGPAAG
jgi:hypothetical protein